jgi:hypothetical protein
VKVILPVMMAVQVLLLFIPIKTEVKGLESLVMERSLNSYSVNTRVFTYTKFF